MTRTLLIAAAAAALALTAGRAGAVAPDPVKIRATYERLCTGDAPASLATCEALRRDMEDAGTPGTQGWTGILVGPSDDGVKAAYVYGVTPGSPGAVAGLRAGDRLIMVDGQPVTDGKSVIAAFGPAGAGRRVDLKFLRGSSLNEVSVKLTEAPKVKPILNAERTNRGAYSLWSGSALTVDKIQVTETFQGILEDSDATHDWGWREDCVEIVGAASKPLVVFFTPNGSDMRVYAQLGDCSWATPSTRWGDFSDGRTRRSFTFEGAPAGQRTFLLISGHSTSKPYELVVREQTPKETIAYREDVQRRQIAAAEAAAAERRAEEQRSADRSALFGAIVSGVVAGVTNTPIPAMREDGSAPNLLEQLNAANAVMQQRNVESAARLNATIAAAQAQGERQRREAAQRDAEEARSRQQAQQAKIEHDRQGLTNVLGNSKTVYEQRAREAAARGDVQAQQFNAQKAREVDAAAQRVGVGNEVRQYAQNKRVPGQGQLGQTPIGPLPAPILAPKTTKPQPQPIPPDRIGKADVCIPPGLGGTDPGYCDAPKRPVPRPAPAPTPGGGGASGTPMGAGPVWWEAVTLCALNDSQAQFGNYRCEGPLQMNYVNFNKPNWQAQMALTGCDHFRDLGVVNGYKAFACGFLMEPGQYRTSRDVPAAKGITYIPGRRSANCPNGRKSCPL